MPLDLEPLELEPVRGKLDLEPLDLEPVEPTSNQAADFARRIPEGMATGTARTIQGAARFADIARDTPAVPFFGGIGMDRAAQTQATVNQQIAASNRQRAATRQQRMEESTAYQFGAQTVEDAQGFYGVDRARDDEFLGQLATAAGEMVPTLVVGALTGPLGAGAQYAASAGESQAQEAIAAGRPETADIAFLSAAGLGGLTEAALGVPGRLFAIANRARKAGVNPGRFGQWANRNPVKSGILKAGAEGGVREAGQEGLEQAGGNLIASDVAGYDPNRPTGQGVGRAMALGGVLGGVMGGGAAGANQVSRNQQAAALREGRTVRVNPDGPAYVVNTETGGTEFGPVDELPAPLALEMIEDSGEKIEDRPAQAAPSTLYPLPSILSLEPLEGQPYDLSPPETLPPEATPPSTAAPAPAGLPTTKSEPISSQLVVEPIQFSPFDTAASDPEARPRVREDNRSEWQDPLVPQPGPAPGTAFDPSQVRTVEFPLAKLKLSKDVPNFKGGASEETGTVAGQELAGKYQRTGTAPIVVWERLNGDHEVITGRHRFDLARRTGEKTIPSQVVREADGFTKAQALTFDAEANIRDGQGEVADYATYFKGTEIPETEARARGLLSRAKGKAGWSLAKAATDDVYALWRADKLTDAQAVAIATAAPGDAGAQQIGSKFALQGKGADFIANVIKASKAEAGQRAESLDLFGADDSAMVAMAEQAERASGFQKAIRDRIQVLTAGKKSEAAKSEGIDVRNPEAIPARIGELKAELAQWENWPMQPDLVAKVRGERGQRIREDAPEAQPIKEEMDRLVAKADALHKAMAEGQTKYLTQPVDLLSEADRARLSELSLKLRPKSQEEAKADVMAKRAARKAEPFSLSPAESVAQQTARLAQEQAGREAKAQQDKLAELQAKPLQGTTGDLGQGDMFAAPDDLFAPPTPKQDTILALLDAADAKLKGPGGLMEGVTGLPVWATREAARGVIKVMRAAYLATRDIAAALRAGLDWLRKQNLKGFIEAEANEFITGLVKGEWGEGAMDGNKTDGLKLLDGDLDLGFKSTPTVFEIAMGFQNRFGRAIDYTNLRPEDNGRLVASLVQEIKRAVKLHPEALGWYDENLNLAMDVMRDLDPDLAKPENNFIFKAILAATSDGNKVGPQFKQTWQEYSHWKKHHQIYGGFVSGDRGENIRLNLGMLNDLIAHVGWEQTRDFMVRKGTVAELRQALVDVYGWTKEEANKIGTAERIDERVPFAIVLGPKLGSFFANLYGDYSSVTMDRWFMRTIGRLTGTLAALLPEGKLREMRNRLRDAVSKLTPEQFSLLNIPRGRLVGSGINDSATTISGRFAKKELREVAQQLEESGQPALVDVRLAANALKKGLKPMAEAPDNGTHRRWIRERVDEVQQILKADGIEMENADLQAVLWYLEKELYEKLKYRVKQGDNDYAAAANSVYEAIDGRQSPKYTRGLGRIRAIGDGSKAVVDGAAEGRAAPIRSQEQIDSAESADAAKASIVQQLDAAIESAKIKPGGLYSLPDLGLTVTLWNGTLNAVQISLRAGQRLAEAIQTGIDWLRAQGQQFDEAKVRAALEQAILQSPGVREHVGKRLLQEDFSPAAKAAVEKLLLHEVKPDEQLFAEAAAVIEAVGPREALASYFGNPWGLPQDSHVVLGFALGNALSTMETQARAAGDAATANRIGQENAEFQSQFVLQSTETARTLRAYRYFDLVGNLSPFTADVFARKVIEKANAQERNRLKPTLDTVGTELDQVNQQAVNEAAGDKGVQGTARTVINQTIQAEAEQLESAVRKAIVLEVSNTLETLPSVVRKASEAVVQAWHKLGLEEQVRVQTGRAGQALENSLWSAVKQRGGSASTVASVIAQVNRALHEQVNRALGVTKEQFTNPATYLMRLRDALGNAEVMSRIWEQTRAAVGANLRAIGEMEGLLLRIEAEIAELEAQAKLPLAGGPEVTATDPKLKAQQQGARDAMLAGRNANLTEAIKQRRERLADVAAQLEEFRKMKPAWEAVLGMTVDVWGPNLLRGVLREQMKADGFRLRKAVADHFRGLAGAPDPLATLGTLTKKIIAASGLDEQAAGRLAKDFEAEYTALVEKERARLAERLAKTRERQAARAKQRAADQPRLDAEALIDGYERRQTEWLKPTGRKSAVRAIVRQALRQGAAVAGLDEQAVRGGLQAHLVAVGVPTEAAYRLAYEVWQARQAAGGGVDAVVAGRVKALQLNLGAIVRKHWSEVGRAGESLAAQIVGETKMPAEQAERLADAIERRFKALATAKKEALLRNLAKTPAARQLQKKSVSQRIIEFSNLGAFDSEGLWNAVAEKLGLASYSAEASAEVKRLAEKAQQLPEGSVQRQEATARLMRFIARQHGLKLGDLGWAFWYANTLSGPITHLVNIGSNSLSLAGNVATQFRDVRGIPQILAATAKGFRTGGQEARAILKQGPGANRTKFTEQGQALENLDPQDFTGAGLARKWRIVARALAAADAAFYFPAREAKAITLARALARQEGKTGAAIGQQARDLLDGTEQQQNLWGAQVDRERAQLEAMGEKPDALWTVRRLEQLRELAWGADIGEAADDFALRTTYNNQPYGLIGALADVAQFAQRKVPGVRLIVPFVNIVANVTNESINYTPWGFARAYAAGQTGVPSVNALWSEKLRDGQTPLTPDAVIDLHTKAALGTALVGGIMAAALAGLDDDDGENFQLYGQGPKDPAARKAWKETGAIPYSVRVNGKYISIANTPLAIPLGAMGNYLDASRWDKRFEEANAFNRLGVALWGGAHVITQQSFLDSAARLAGAIENPRGRSDTLGDRGLAEALRSGGNLVVPNALRQLDRMFDPTLYDNRGIEGALVASIPFARRNGSPALNAFGEPITSSPWARFASDAKPNVWADLAHRGVYPSTAEKVKNRWGREMTDEEHYRYVELSGQAIKRRLDTPGMRAKIRTGEEQELRKALTGIVKDEREKARTKLGF